MIVSPSENNTSYTYSYVSFNMMDSSPGWSYLNNGRSGYGYRWNQSAWRIL